MPTRSASHAGSWYSAERRSLASKLDNWLDDVPTAIPYIRSGNAVTDERSDASVSALAGSNKNKTVNMLSTKKSANIPVTGARVIIAP